MLILLVHKTHETWLLFSTPQNTQDKRGLALDVGESLPGTKGGEKESSAVCYAVDLRAWELKINFIGLY